jgi:hypothetical protein
MRRHDACHIRGYVPTLAPCSWYSHVHLAEVWFRFSLFFRTYSCIFRCSQVQLCVANTSWRTGLSGFSCLQGWRLEKSFCFAHSIHSIQLHSYHYLYTHWCGQAMSCVNKGGNTRCAQLFVHTLASMQREVVVSCVCFARMCGVYARLDAHKLCDGKAAVESWNEFGKLTNGRFTDRSGSKSRKITSDFRFSPKITSDFAR